MNPRDQFLVRANVNEHISPLYMRIF